MSKKCFVISPIGTPGSNIRKKADELLNYLIRPVLTELGYLVIRADELPHPGSITRDIVENIDESDLVIAIISDHNPNVFYELAVRNAIEKPIILMNKEGDEKLPFDIQGKRVIEYCDECGNMSSKEIQEKIKNTKNELKKQVESAEIDPQRASSSILSEYLQLPKRLENCVTEKISLKKKYDSNRIQVKRQLILLSTVFLLVLITGLFVYPLDIQNEYHALLREKQSSSIEDLTYKEIQNLIDASNLYTIMFTVGYEPEENTQEFVNRITNELKFTDIFIPNLRVSDVVAYVYVMEPDPECEFLLYAYLQHMERENGAKLESCFMMNDNEIYLTSMYPSTGTTSFVNALAKRIDLDPNDGTYDLIISSAIDWDRFSNNIQRAITLENTRFVLVDAQNFVVVDCDKNSCKNIKDQAQSVKDFSENSIAKKYDPNEYNMYQNHADPILLNNNDLEIYDIQNSVLLKDWKIYMHYI